MGVGSYHEKGGAGGDNCVVPWNVFDADTRKTDWDDCPEAKDFFNESSDIGNFLFHETFLPSVSVGVDFHDLFKGTCLDLLSVCGSEISYSHDKITRDCINSSGNHG